MRLLFLAPSRLSRGDPILAAGIFDRPAVLRALAGLLVAGELRAAVTR